MPVDRLDLTAEEFEQLTGWEIKPEGACQDDVCVPFPRCGGTPRGGSTSPWSPNGSACRSRDEVHGLWALGPRSGDRRVLDRARMPELELQDFDGNAFHMASVRGRKVVLIAWASW